MSTTENSSASQRLAKEVVWRWIRSRWPSLVPSGASMDRREVESSLPGRALSAPTTADDRVWTLSVANQERHNAPVWITRLSITGTATGHRFRVETACSDVAATSVISPPALLGNWVDRLELADGTIPVVGVPRMVEDEVEAMGLVEHIAAPERELPLLVLAAKGASRYYGTDPKVLAQALRGLAHVACLALPAQRICASALGRSMAPPPGAARIYAAGATLHADAGPAHQILYPSRADSTENDAGRPGTAFRRKLVRRVCESSVAGNTARIA